MMSDNPYAPPETGGVSEVVTDPRGDELAGRFTRLAAAIVDGILLLVILVPVQFASGYFQRAMAQQQGPLEQILMSLLGFVTMLVLNGYLLATRGQTIGKVLTKIQIVDVESGKLLSFLHVYVYRYMWTIPVFIVVMLIPGTTDDLVFNVVVFIDALMIFGSARRCFHDYIAGSKVVLYREGRQRAT
jgi:uncharacterized RDD family membrane protein YckC